MDEARLPGPSEAACFLSMILRVERPGLTLGKVLFRSYVPYTRVLHFLVPRATKPLPMSN
jgi:hypothetical protein